MMAGFCCLQGQRNQGFQLHWVVRPHSDCAERLSELYEVGIVEVGLVGSCERLVQVARNVAVRVVPEDDGDYVDAVLHGGGKLGRVEHEAAVSGHAHHGAVGLGHLCAQRGRERVAEIERIAGIYVRLWVLHLVVGAGVVPELRNVPDYECVFRDAPLHRLQDRVLRLPEPDVVVGYQVASRGDRIDGRRTLPRSGLDQIGEQRFYCRPGVAVQGDGVGLDPGELGVVYVDVHQCGRLARRITQRKTRADPYHDVGGLHHFVKLVHLLPLAARAEAGPVRQGMAVRNGPLAAAGGDDGDVCRFGQLHEGLFRVRPRYPAAGVYEGQAGLGDDTGGFPEILTTGHNPRDAGGIPQLDFLSLHPCLRRHLNQNRAGTAGAHLPERLEHGIRHFPGPQGLSLPFGHGADRARLVLDLVNGPDVLADCAARDLARNKEHRR